MASEPFLSHFATPLTAQPHPALRLNPDKQITEIQHKGQWVDASEHPELLGLGQTKTAVEQESTDYA